MMILWKERLSFLAVPKTGSTPIETALTPFASITYKRDPHIKHMTHQRFNRFIRPYLKKEQADDMELFAVMREPVSWLGSWYRYCQREDLRGDPKSTLGISFDDFVEAYLGKGQERPAFARFGSQARQLSKSREEEGMDHLFQYENMPALLDFLADRIGKKLVLPERNVSPAMEVSLSPGILNKLHRKHALDFDTYADISKG